MPQIRVSYRNSTPNHLPRFSRKNKEETDVREDGNDKNVDKENAIREGERFTKVRERLILSSALL